MAAGFNFDGTDDYVTLADAAGYDVSPNGGSFTMAAWINPDSRTAMEVLFDRSAWFQVYLSAQNDLTIKFADGTSRVVARIPDSLKTHVMFNLVHQTAVDTGTADTNVAGLLIDVDAAWWTGGVNMTTDPRGKYIVYNRTDRVYGYGTVIPDVVFTASATTVNTTTEVVTTPVHGLTTGCPVKVTGDDVPAGLTSGNTYYVNAASTTTLKFYDTSANAITGGATGLVNLTDAGSGEVTIAAKEFAIQLDSDFCPDGNEVVMVFTEPWAATLRVWINGVRQVNFNETISNFNTPADTNTVINVARLATGANYYDGKMNEVVYWTPGVATDGIARAVYNGGTELEAFEGVDGAMTLYGHWSFDESAANTAVDNDEGTAARDGTAGANTSTYATATLDPTSYYVADKVIKLTAATTLTGTYVIKSMLWDGSVTADDDLVVQDGAGGELWVVNTKIAADTASIELNTSVEGIKLVTIDAGSLYIYLR